MRARNLNRLFKATQPIAKLGALATQRNYLSHNIFSKKKELVEKNIKSLGEQMILIEESWGLSSLKETMAVLETLVEIEARKKVNRFSDKHNVMELSGDMFSKDEYRFNWIKYVDLLKKLKMVETLTELDSSIGQDAKCLLTNFTKLASIQSESKGPILLKDTLDYFEKPLLQWVHSKKQAAKKFELINDKVQIVKIANAIELFEIGIEQFKNVYRPSIKQSLAVEEKSNNCVRP